MRYFFLFSFTGYFLYLHFKCFPFPCFHSRNVLSLPLPPYPPPSDHVQSKRGRLGGGGSCCIIIGKMLVTVFFSSPPPSSFPLVQQLSKHLAPIELQISSSCPGKRRKGGGGGGREGLGRERRKMQRRRRAEGIGEEDNQEEYVTCMCQNVIQHIAVYDNVRSQQ